ncbi:MAG TPA: hypothetical protein VKB93_27130 [Thermoanaerobaculia bacterium]|nr:hypothetical protein [Thermoanaerobaculia bacterium]
MFNETLRARMLAQGGRLAYPIPDALTALIYAAAAAFPSFFPMELRDDLAFALLAEGAFLMMQGTLVDIATRLRKRPPVWAVPLIFGGVLLFSEHAREMLRFAWQRGPVVFAPLLLSLVQRATVLWRMPERPRIERIAARALIANRISTGLALLAVLTATMIAGVVFPQSHERLSGPWVFLTIGAIYFAIAAFDDWRVRGPKFADRPSVLFRYDAIGIDYLAPL